MRKDKVIVFFEVKTRRSDSYGLAEFSITPKKLSALFRCINHYLAEQDLEDMEWQLDLLVVEKFNKDEDAEILHFERLGEYDD
jgi:Holliday junction resolvase-like predicted endonuclease